jgi:putative transcriptional regulator
MVHGGLWASLRDAGRERGGTPGRRQGKMCAMAGSSELTSPVLLLAMPQVLDPFFHRTVVLLIHHDAEGSLGFIVNRPTSIRVDEILKGMDVVWNGSGEANAYFGGPLQPQLGTVLFGPKARPFAVAAAPAEDDEETGEGTEAASEVLPGLSLTQHIGDLAQLAADPPDRFRLFLGYAGWGAGQLVEEILRNDWLTAPVKSDLIFSPNPEQVWKQALASVGVDPASLPSWTTPGNGEETTN